MDERLTLDGNGIAGLLAEVMPGDPTAVVRRCGGCGASRALGAHRAYRGAGLVLRCPECADVAVVIGVAETRLTVALHGSFTVERPSAA